MHKILFNISLFTVTTVFSTVEVIKKYFSNFLHIYYMAFIDKTTITWIKEK